MDSIATHEWACAAKNLQLRPQRAVRPPQFERRPLLVGQGRMQPPHLSACGLASHDRDYELGQVLRETKFNDFVEQEYRLTIIPPMPVPNPDNQGPFIRAEAPAWDQYLRHAAQESN